MQPEKPATLTDKQMTKAAGELEIPVKYRAALKAIANTQKKFTALKAVVNEIMACNAFKQAFDTQVLYRHKAVKGLMQNAYMDVASVYLARWGVSSKLVAARVVQSEAIRVQTKSGAGFAVLPLWAVGVDDPAKRKQLAEKKEAGEEFTDEEERDFLEAEQSLADDKVRDGVPMLEEAHIVVPDVRLHMHWVYEHLDDEGPNGVTMSMAPSKGAWAMLQEARKDKSTFFNRYWLVFTKKSEEEEERKRMEDDGRQAIGLISELKYARAESLKTAEYVKSHAQSEEREDGEKRTTRRY